MPDFGFEIQDGWLPLVYKLCEDLQATGFPSEGSGVGQIKEKFGGLRFYVDIATKEQYSLIDKAEEDSYHICEYCGEPGTLTKGGWLKTLCEKCKELK